MASRFDRDAKASGPVVQGFSGHGFAVDGGVYEGLLLTPLRADAWEPPALVDLDIDALAPLLALDPPPEFVLLGTGSAMAFAPRALVKALDAQGIALDAMDSRAAARAWGMLRGEGRWIAAALMPLD